MKCPFCSFMDSKVVESRPTDDGAVIRRRRECLSCSKRFTTYEKLEHSPLMVVKRDGNRQAFDRDKLIKGIVKSCEKRPVKVEDMEEIVDRIENRITTSYRKEVNSTEIGEMVMEELKELDDVAYVRFASVYRQFKDLNSFLEELNKIVHYQKSEEK